MTNPTVPNTVQKAAIEASTPDAKSVKVADASDNKDVAVVGVGAPVVKEEDKDQGTTPAVDLTKTTGKEHAKQQEENAKTFEKNVGEDSLRRAARLEREAEKAAAEGDPTRDPVAKQAAMDANTPAPGALRDAQKIKNIGDREAEKQAKKAGVK